MVFTGFVSKVPSGGKGLGFKKPVWHLVVVTRGVVEEACREFFRV